LVDGTGVGERARALFRGHRLSGDARFVDERIPGDDLTVDRHQRAWVDKHRITDLECVDRDLPDCAVATHHCGSRQIAQQVADRRTTARNGHVLENFGCQDEHRNDQRGEGLSDRSRRDERDRHRKLHRHPTLEDVFERLFENGVARDQRRDNTDDADVRKRLLPAEPDGGGRNDRKGNSGEFERIDFCALPNRRSLEVRPNDVDELVGSLAPIALRRSAEHVREDVLLEDFRHQTVHSAAGSGNELERLAAVGFGLKGALDGLALSSNASDAREQFRLVANSMAHESRFAIERVIYPPILYYFWNAGAI
jgi:hypothetical protein